MYARRSSTDNSAIANSTSSSGSNGDLWLQNSEFSKKVMATADDDPYVFVVGLGDYATYKESAPHKAYTCFFGIYWATKDSDPIFFDGNQWVTEYPWTTAGNAAGNNTFNIQGENIKLQMYILKDGPGGNMWNALQKKLGLA